MDLPASSSGAPITPGQKLTPAAPPAITLTPGHIVSARVLEALGADTYLLAMRGRTLVASSPTPLSPDTIVQLVVQAAEDPAAPVPVKLLVPATPAALAASVIGGPLKPTVESRVATMIAELGLPPGPAAGLTVSAFIRLGVPLADPRATSQPKPSVSLRSVMQVVQSAIDAGGSPEETSLEPTATAPSQRAPSTLAQKHPGHPSIAPALTPPSGNVIATAHTPRGEAASSSQGNVSGSAEATSTTSFFADAARPSSTHQTPREGANPLHVAVASPNEPRISGAPSLVSQARLTLGAYGIVSFTGTTKPVDMTTATDSASSELSQPPRGHPGGISPTPLSTATTMTGTTTPKTNTATSAAQTMIDHRPTGTLNTPVSPSSKASPSSLSVPARDTNRQHVPSPPIPEVSMVELTSRSRHPGTIATAPSGPVLFPTQNPADRIPAAFLRTTDDRISKTTPSSPSSVPDAELATQRRDVTASPIVKTQATASPSPHDLATAGARLVRASLPVTAATLAIALRAPQAQLPDVARLLPPALADAIDPEKSAPTNAMRATLQLAGVVPMGMPADPAQTLLQQLIRIAVRVGSAVPTAPVISSSITQSEPVPGALAPKSPADPAIGPAPITAPTVDEGRIPVSIGPQPALELPRGTDPTMVAVQDVAAEQLLPPAHLDDYDRVIALPMMHAGHPVPARLAVTTRRTASGGTACWMRVDCSLSQLGAVSVRLSGADGGPVAVTLIAAPAAAAILAEALPALTGDLHAKGVVAALRVVAHDGDLTEVA